MAWLTTCLRLIIDCDDPSTHSSLSNTHALTTTNTMSTILCQIHALTNTHAMSTTVLQSLTNHHSSNACFKKQTQRADSFCLSTNVLQY